MILSLLVLKLILLMVNYIKIISFTLLNKIILNTEIFIVYWIFYVPSGAVYAKVDKTKKKGKNGTSQKQLG